MRDRLFKRKSKILYYIKLSEMPFHSIIMKLEGKMKKEREQRTKNKKFITVCKIYEDGWLPGKTNFHARTLTDVLSLTNCLINNSPSVNSFDIKTAVLGL